jgi:hypothetical protein
VLDFEPENRFTLATITCDALEIDTAEDDRLFAEACARRGIACVSVAWDRDDLPAHVDAAVLRTTWNYHLRPDAFRAWLRRAAAAVPLFNDLDTLLANIDKSYLIGLAAAGVRTAPTHLVERGSPADLAEIASSRGWQRVVVKPAISANGYLTMQVEPEGFDAGQRLLEIILRERAALVQPVMDDVYAGGERCLIFFDGRYSHGVVKRPFAIDAAGTQPLEGRPDDMALAQRALATLPSVPLYARVDIVRDASDAPCVMELELVEPELYLRYAPGAADRFAAALRARLDAARRSHGDGLQLRALAHGAVEHFREAVDVARRRDVDA